MARLEQFCDDEGLAMVSLGHEVTAAFVEKGLSSRTPSTPGHLSIGAAPGGRTPTRAGRGAVFGLAGSGALQAR